MKKKVVEFEGTKNRYLVLSDEAKIKHPETREWMDGVIYQEYKRVTSRGDYEEVSQPNVYVREKEEFKKKFSLCLDL